jgi:nucleoside-diphosphate-sugar epimerase
MTVLIAGCGDLGTEVGLRFAALGHRVVGLRRSAHVLPAEITGQSVDLSRERPEIPADTEFVVMPIAPSYAAGAPRSGETYRSTYLDTLRNLLDALDAAAVTPRRFLLVSSTAVYAVSDGSVVDESTPARPETPNAVILLEAEELLRSRQPGAVVFRLTGVYGPGREQLITQVRESRAAPVGPGHHTNRIHRDDAAAAIVHLLTMHAQPAPLYIGVDSAPVERDEVVEFLAAELGATLPASATSPALPTPGPTRGGDKLCRNDLLLATGFRFAYPDYRTGYRAILAGEGTRHP